MSTTTPKLPDALEKMIDTVLAYKPKPKSKAAKKRGRLKRKKSLNMQPCTKHDSS